MHVSQTGCASSYDAIHPRPNEKNATMKISTSITPTNIDQPATGDIREVFPVQGTVVLCDTYPPTVAARHARAREALQRQSKSRRRPDALESAHRGEDRDDRDDRDHDAEGGLLPTSKGHQPHAPTAPARRLSMNIGAAANASAVDLLSPSEMTVTLRQFDSTRRSFTDGEVTHSKRESASPV